MEDIISLVVVLALGIIAKVVEKKFQKSGSHASKPVTDSVEEPDEKPFDLKKWIESVAEEKDEEQEDSDEVPVLPVQPAPAPVRLAPKPASRPVQTPKMPVASPVLTEESPKVREKIDPKKLIVYSELMKPKFKEEN